MAETQYNSEEIDNVFMEKAGKMDRPLPGESLTNDPENPLPFEKAPEYTDLTTALEYYFATFTEEGTYDRLLELIASGTPLMDITQMILYQGFQEGLFNPDLMMMLAEPITYMLAAFAEQEQIEFIIQEDDEDDEDDEEEEPQSLPMMKQALKQVKTVDNPEVMPEKVQSLLAARGEQ
jgi:hypothetical protein|tara:strand:+ start:626 stop:1159 length:534 start_codon:yes stop_codon:yes gene_type:complete